ncbi:cytochrome P450 71A1-like [Gastrolobium bilobum]|uniref:cytochrome P450 71A1-like n=1 Tax=Gastrolobium bilobum TaxID=150636 RepID=UPI002AB2EEF2|nr:cytochrome P450 71A1-like [Gastrolobium bilobum]
MMSLLLLLLCLTLPLLLLFFFHKHRTINNPPLPPGPRGLPIIGNLHQLDNSVLYLQLWKLSKIYGPLFSLQLGLRPAIVVSSPKIAREVLKDNDLVFSDRPNLLGQQKLFYNGLEIVFSPYNDSWREIRKICVVHIFSSKRVSCFSSIREFEVKQMIKKISGHASSSVVTNLSELFISLSSTIICRIAFGRRYVDEGAETKRFHKMFNELQAMVTAFFVSDYIPFLGWVDKVTGLNTRLERIFNEFDKFYQVVIDEHLDPNRQQVEEQDIVDVLLQLRKRRSFSIDITYDHIKGVLTDLLIAATDTTAATSVWAMTTLIKNPRVMKKVQEEIWNLGGKKDFLDEDDIQKFSYLKAVIKEILRLYVTTPLLVPRESNKNCIIDGYQIPAKTIVYVNAWAIHRDPEAWKDPEEFYPERFLDSAIDFRGQDFELIPFGAGRRICPGLHMGVATLELILANLLNSFDWELPKGLVKEDIDTEVLPGITQHKKNPLCLSAKRHMDLMTNGVKYEDMDKGRSNQKI